MSRIRTAQLGSTYELSLHLVSVLISTFLCVLKQCAAHLEKEHFKPKGLCHIRTVGVTLYLNCRIYKSKFVSRIRKDYFCKNLGGVNIFPDYFLWFYFLHLWFFLI